MFLRIIFPLLILEQLCQKLVKRETQPKLIPLLKIITAGLIIPQNFVMGNQVITVWALMAHHIFH